MKKKILITGATDGIGFLAAKKLIEQGHHVILHGRNSEKLDKIHAELSEKGDVSTVICDMSNLREVMNMTNKLRKNHSYIDIIVNNTGVAKTTNHTNSDGIDIRFVVNAIASYLLTREIPSLSSIGVLMPICGNLIGE